MFLLEQIVVMFISSKFLYTGIEFFIIIPFFFPSWGFSVLLRNLSRKMINRNSLCLILWMEVAGEELRMRIS